MKPLVKPLMTIFAPVATRSGYGDLARDFCRMVIDLDTYDVKIISAPWGACPMNALHADNPRDVKLLSHILPNPPQLNRQPEVHVHIGVPNEIQTVGKFNIIFTAGIETTLCSPQWIEGCNRADLILASSAHAKKSLLDTIIQQRDQTGNTLSEMRVTKPVEVLHCCVHTDVFKKISSMDVPRTLDDQMLAVEEKFNFLFVGHWIKGGLGEDRKNIGVLVKTFCETFANTPKMSRPGLILKTSGAGFSILDQADILRKIREIKNAIPNAPNVYLIHGELSEAEMNGLYNHPKVKAHVSFTKGEGFGRPLLEATMSERPVIASGWSGHVDFLHPDDVLLVGGEVRQIEPGAVWDGVLIPESSWFNIDTKIAARAMQYCLKQYDKVSEGAKRQAIKNRKNFNYEKIKADTEALLEKYVPKTAQPVALKLPSLKIPVAKVGV
jgi:hypothetical protein